MRLNKKGMTMVEIMVSVVLISIVLIFLMNLFVSVRNTYNQSKIQSDYEMLQSNIINSIGKDVENYGLTKIEVNADHDTAVFTYNAYRQTNLSKNIVKVLKIYRDAKDKFFISYGYESCSGSNVDMCTTNITSLERITNVVREFPEDAILGGTGYILIKDDSTPLNYGINGSKSNATFSTSNLIEIKIPLSNHYGNIFDINIYARLVQ